MHKVLPYSPPDNGGINRTNLFRKIWTEPRATLSYILANQVDEHVSLLFVLGGITRAIGRAITQYPTNKMGGATTLILAIVGGSISGMITYTGYAWGMSLMGGWLGGKASSDQLKTVIGWALVPTIATLLLLIPTLAVLSDEVSGMAGPLLPNSLALACALLQIGLGIWSTVILLKGVALVQEFTIGRSLVNVLLPGALLIGLILLVSTFW
ncbi:MAG: YIP1 family protein [Janthinobacterium lividum]